jgi:tetratricopeptide (TPR) repeat protein
MTNLAMVYVELGRYEEAEGLYLGAIEGQKRALGSEHNLTIYSMGHLRNLYSKQGRTDDIRRWDREMLDAWQRRAERIGLTAWGKNVYAWLLLTCEPPEARDPQMALTLALDANAMTGNEHYNYLDTLSLAYHLTGDTVKAIENQRKAVNLLPPGPHPLRAELEARLAEFEAALDGSAEPSDDGVVQPHE